ncbi:MAG: ABC transporter permease, partial [Chloroflexota bacterium]
MTAPTTSGENPPPQGTLARRLAIWLHPRRGLQLRLLLAGPLGWLVIAYLGSLFILLLNAFWAKDAFTGRVEPFAWTLNAFGDLFGNEVYRTVALRTVAMAVLVTLTDALLAFPIAWYMARMASPRMRSVLVIAVLMPLWAAYLVKVYAWRTILQGNGFLDWALGPFGLEGPGLDEISNAWLVLSYLWLPYMILPIYAGLERIPNSLLEASADLGGRA